MALAAAWPAFFSALVRIWTWALVLDDAPSSRAAKVTQVRALNTENLPLGPSSNVVGLAVSSPTAFTTFVSWGFVRRSWTSGSPWGSSTAKLVNSRFMSVSLASSTASPSDAVVQMRCTSVRNGAWPVTVSSTRRRSGYWLARNTLSRDRFWSTRDRNAAVGPPHR